MSTGKFLCPGALNLSRVGRVPRAHLLSAYDTGILAAEILDCGIGILVHVLQSLSVTDERMQPLQERSRSHEPVSEDMNGKVIEGKYDTKKGCINAKLDEI